MENVQSVGRNLIAKNQVSEQFHRSLSMPIRNRNCIGRPDQPFKTATGNYAILLLLQWMEIQTLESTESLHLCEFNKLFSKWSIVHNWTASNVASHDTTDQTLCHKMTNTKPNIHALVWACIGVQYVIWMTNDHLTLRLVYIWPSSESISDVQKLRD